MSGYSDWKNVESGLNGTIEGRLPLNDDTGPAGAFQYRKDLLFFVPFATFGGSLQRTITGTWKIQIRVNEEENSTVLFEQEVTWTAIVTAIGDPFFGDMGGITMAVWQPGNDTPEAIQTTVINGQTIDPGTAYKYLDQSNATPLSQFGTTLFTAEGIATVGGIWLDAQWLSPRYRMDIPVGAVLHIVNDHWQIGQLRREATYAFAFKPGTPVFSSFGDIPGALQLAVPVSDRVEVHHAYTLDTPEVRAVFKSMSHPSIFKDLTDRLWLGGLVNNSYKLFYSRNNGLTFNAVAGKGGEEIVIWDGSFKNPHTLGLQDGTIVSIAYADGYLWFKSSRDDFNYSVPVGTASSSRPYQIVERGLGNTLQITDGFNDNFISRDGGRGWVKQDAAT